LNGETAFPAPSMLPQAREFEIPSREARRSIPCRLIYPSNGVESTSTDPSSELKPKVTGIIMHIHGGGWVLMDHRCSDPLLQQYADLSGCVSISVGYRLAPEDPFPAGPEDCYDVADWLIENGEKKFGAKLRFIGGESAGGHLSVLTAYHILRNRPSFPLTADHFGGLILHFGAYDLSLLPSALTSPLSEAPLILSRTNMVDFADAFLSGISKSDFKDPSISPLFEDLEKWRGKLPPALFTCGTIDPLRDDTVNMAVKWLSAGSPAGTEGVVVKLYPGAAHGFLAFPPEVYEPAALAWKDIKAWIKARDGKHD